MWLSCPSADVPCGAGHGRGIRQYVPGGCAECTAWTRPKGGALVERRGTRTAREHVSSPIFGGRRDRRIRDIVEGLDRLSRTTGVWEIVDRNHANGRFLADLGIALLDRYGHDPQPAWQYRDVFDRLLRTLTLAHGSKNVGQAMRMTSGGRHGASPRYVASLLASGQSAQDLAGAFSDPDARGSASAELRACLLQELVIRGAQIDDIQTIAHWAASDAWTSHLLSWLPLSRAAIEDDPPLPTYGMGGDAYSQPFAPYDMPPLQRVVATWPPSCASEITTGPRASAMAAAVANWADQSNGRSEARVFEFAEAVPSDHVAQALLAVDLACLQGLQSPLDLACTAIPPAQAWRILFAAASLGGAYNRGEYGAYGRLAVWQSLAGLTDAPAGASVAEVQRYVDVVRWYRFAAPSDWFDQVAWDLGLAALTPDGRRLMVLAATDTD